MKYFFFSITISLSSYLSGQLLPSIDTLNSSSLKDTIGIYNICPAGAIPPNGNLFTFFDDYVIPKINGGSIQYDLHHNKKGYFEMQFIVEKDGRVTSVKVLSSVGSQIDAEFVRILSLSFWKPAYQNGQPVRQRIHLDTYIEY